MQEQRQNNPSRFLPIIKVFTAIVVALLTFGLLLILIYSPSRVPLVFFDPTITPTYLTNTPATTNTPQPTQTATITSTPLPTQTPFPASAYIVTDMSSIRPALNRIGESAVILNEDVAIVDPPLDHFQWISSSTIAQDIGYEIAEPYYATFGAGSITWNTDLPMKPALYELFIMDTLFSSGGELDFTVRLNDQIIEPIVGASFVDYQSSQGEPPQYNDVWQSLGIYDISQIGIISVSTEWSSRDERSIVAVDRVLILELSEKTRTILQALPENTGTLYIADDTDASFDSTQYWDYWEDPSAWGGQYQVISDPPLTSSVTWTIPATLTFGDYDIYVWVPKINGIAPVTYRVYASGLQMPNTDGIEDVLLSEGQGHSVDAYWLHLGTWIIPERFGDSVRFTINLVVEENISGDVVVDAIALLRK